MEPGPRWSYAHQNLDEPRLPDGSPILRPCVIVSTVSSRHAYFGVVDSGSPLTVADPAFLVDAGLDLGHTRPAMEIPLGMGATFGYSPMYRIELELLPPDGVDAKPRRWPVLVAARGSWRFPFAVLLGQRGWFDRFPTTVDATHTTVHLPR